ncbi:MAG: 4-hydroxy-2-oxovalerate aldolase, partial [Endomicrobium sp.]|nr:4-hydroxy-2-oxovalerate aldolase [Endomicrobium sp.]
LIFDSTLRDGSHALKQQLELSTIRDYCDIVDNSGVDSVIIGHGNGLGASSLQIGLSKYSDKEMLIEAKNHLKKTKLGVYMIPGFGTIKDNLLEAIDIGVDIFKIGCHCTEADTTKEHIEFLHNHNKQVYGILMMSHMASPKRLLEEVLKMESYGALGVILMDSAGFMLPTEVKERVSFLTSKSNIKIGFHAHNNLGCAVANTLMALDSGASIVDATVRGFGAGAGNCQLETLVAIMKRVEKDFDINLYKLLDASEMIKKISPLETGVDTISIMMGVAGIFSAFKNKIRAVAKEFGVDERDIILELEKKKAIGGQEDMIIESAMAIIERNNNKKDNSTSFLETLS